MEEEVHKDLTGASEKDLLKLLRKESPELFVMLPDLKKRLQAISTEIQPLVAACQEDPPSLSGRPLSSAGALAAECRSQLHVTYCTLLLGYLLLKAEHRNTTDHPLMHLLVRSRFAIL